MITARELILQELATTPVNSKTALMMQIEHHFGGLDIAWIIRPMAEESSSELAQRLSKVTGLNISKGTISVWRKRLGIEIGDDVRVRPGPKS